MSWCDNLSSAASATIYTFGEEIAIQCLVHFPSFHCKHHSTVVGFFSFCWSIHCIKYPETGPRINPWPKEYSATLVSDSFNYWLQQAIIYHNEIRESLSFRETLMSPLEEAVKEIADFPELLAALNLCSSVASHVCGGDANIYICASPITFAAAKVYRASEEHRVLTRQDPDRFSPYVQMLCRASHESLFMLQL